MPCEEREGSSGQKNQQVHTPAARKMLGKFEKQKVWLKYSEWENGLNNIEREGEAGHGKSFVFYSNCREKSTQGFSKANSRICLTVLKDHLGPV